MKERVELLQGHVLDKLAELKERGVKVRTCVTSPPYWGLRAYGTEPQVWLNGHGGCEKHEWGKNIPLRGTSRWSEFHKDNGSTMKSNYSSTIADGHGNTCSLCGAWRGELGLEPTPELYVQHLVQVFRAVRDVLTDDGTAWINLGDSYNAGREGGHAGGKSGISRIEIAPQRSGVNAPNLKPKDLVGIPWMVAFALRADGWYLRSDIIWHKPNPMPESVRDRPTKSHEYIFLLSKNQKYYYDAEAIAEPSSWADRDSRADGNGKHASNGKSNSKEYAIDGVSYGKKNDDGNFTRNKRSVWTVPTNPYKGAHFATFPPDLIEPCILAGSAKDDIVLDPFGGSGTTAQVAIKHGRRAILIDLNPQYIELQKKRTNGVQMKLQ